MKKIKQMNDYWIERDRKAQAAFTDKTIEETEKQLKKQYKQALLTVMADFEATYDKLLAAGDNPTPADLYKLDKYWQTQAKLTKILQKLGDKEVKLISKQFLKQYEGIYSIFSLQTETAFGTPDLQKANQIVNQIWCADGKSWSDRVWMNTNKLKDELNEKIVDCVVSGRKTSQLKQELIKTFDVSYNRASTLVRTELAHIQTEAAKERYKDYGIKEVEVLAEDAKCKHCGGLNGKHYNIFEKIPIPAHPNCRCCIIPVI